MAKKLGICDRCGEKPCMSTRRTRCIDCDPLCRNCDIRDRDNGSHYCYPCQAERRRFWYNNNPENRAKRLASNKVGNDALRQEVIEAYGSRCACPRCDITQAEFMTLDHVNNDGATDRRSIGRMGGIQFYRYVRDQGYPQDRYQLLCWNCNLTKHIYGQCAHYLF